jgi:hypothetical protein
VSEFKVKVERHYSYEVVVAADSAEQARELVRDYEIEDLESFETDAWFDFSFAEEVK